MGISSQTVLGLALLALLGACGGNGGSGSSSAALSARASAPQTFGLAAEQNIALSVNSITDESGADDNTYSSGAQFWVKASPTAERVFRYGRVASGNPLNSPIRRHNYQIPITVASANGQAVATGTLNVTNRNFLPTGTSSRFFDMEEILLTNTFAGILQVDEAGFNLSGTDIHAYSGGVAATSLPSGAATYNGHFYGRILTAGAGVQAIDLPATLNVDFAGGNVNGDFGGEIALGGTLTGASFSGISLVSGTGLSLASGSSGTFEGGLFGVGAPEASGSVSLSDTSGPAQQELVGAFAATQ